MMEKINNANDFAIILRASPLWLQGKIPKNVLEFCDIHDTALWFDIDLKGDKGIADIMSNLLAMFPFQRKGGDDGALSRAVQLCRVEILEYLADKVGPLFRIYDTITFAAKGSLDCLKFLHRINGRWDSSTCAAAARGGHLDCLRYARENGCMWTKHVVVGAAENGHIDCWKYAHEHGLILYDFEGSEVCGRVAARGNLQGLKFAVEVCGYKLVAEVVSAAARANRADCVRYVIDKGILIPTGGEERVITCVFTHCEGTLEDQIWLRSTLIHAGMWNAKLFDIVSKSSHLKWLREQDCSWDETTVELAVKRGCIEEVRFLMDRGCPYRNNLLFVAAGLGIGYIDILHEEDGLPIDAGGSHFDFAQNSVSRLGERNLKILQYLIEEQGLYMDADGCIFDCALKSASGRLEQYRLEHENSPMPAKFVHRQMQCVRYLLDVGCPHTAEAYNTYLSLLDS